MTRKLGPTLPSTLRAEGIARRPLLLGVAAALISALALLGAVRWGGVEQGVALPIGQYEADVLGSCHVVLPRSEVLSSLNFEVLCRIRPGSEAWAERRFARRKGRLRLSVLARFSDPETAEWSRGEVEARLAQLAEQALFPDEAAVVDDTRRRMEIASVRLSD